MRDDVGPTWDGLAEPVVALPLLAALFPAPLLLPPPVLFVLCDVLVANVKEGEPAIPAPV